MDERLLVVHGAGGHGGVVTATALLLGWQVKQTDDKEGSSPLADEPCIIAIGNARARKAHDHKLLETIIHPMSYIDSTAQVGDGTFVSMGAAVYVGARVGRGCIINTHCTVDHDCRVGDWCHIAPGAVLCGNVTVGEGTWVGANAVVREGVKIAPWTIIGCGAVVVKDIEVAGTYVGNPARRTE